MSKSKSHIIYDLLSKIEASKSRPLSTVFAHKILRDTRKSVSEGFHFGTTFNVFFALYLLALDDIVSAEEANETLRAFREAP